MRRRLLRLCAPRACADWTWGEELRYWGHLPGRLREWLLADWLFLPRIEGLDLRPVWEPHPTLDKVRRGERDWISGLRFVLEWRPRPE